MACNLQEGAVNNGLGYDDAREVASKVQTRHLSVLSLKNECQKSLAAM